MTGLDNGTEYTFQVRAYIEDDAANPAIDAAGGAGDEVTATPGTPADAVDFTVATGFNERARLDWVDPKDSAITKYQYRVAPATDSSGDVDSSGWEWETEVHLITPGIYHRSWRFNAGPPGRPRPPGPSLQVRPPQTWLNGDAYNST